MQIKILLIGGSGLIGKQIQKILMNRLSNVHLLIGGRKKNSENHLLIDVNNPKTFDIINNEWISLVVLCTSDPQDNVLQYCIKHQIDYIDITKPTNSLKKAFELAKVEKVNSRIVLSSGWMGGIVPSLIKYNANFDTIISVNLYIYYSLEDKAGKSSANFMAENVSKSFLVYENNNSKSVRHFENPEKHNFIFNSKTYKVYSFDIPDTFILNKIEGIPNVSAKITYSSSFITRLLAIMQKINVFKLISLNYRKKLFYSSGKGDQTAFEIISKQIDGTLSKISLVSQKGQAYLTALSTCLHIEKLINSTLPNQIYFSHQFYQKNEFIDALKKDKQIKIEIK